jgi:hypothetical protein
MNRIAPNVTRIMLKKILKLNPLFYAAWPVKIYFGRALLSRGFYLRILSEDWWIGFTFFVFPAPLRESTHITVSAYSSASSFSFALPDIDQVSP